MNSNAVFKVSKSLELNLKNPVNNTVIRQHCVTGLCGGSASGKTTVARKIIEALDVPWVVLLSMDSFYKVCKSSQAHVKI